MRRAEALDLLARHVPTAFPGADAALLAGSTARDAATEGSDIDLVVLYERLPAGAWRATERHDGVLVEAFVHDPGTLAWFMSELDARSGQATLARLVLDGVPVSGLPGRCLAEARRIAQAHLDAGPPALAPDEIERRRYTLCNLVDDLDGERSAHERIAIRAALYEGLADFALRAAGRFSGTGKGLAAALEAHDRDLARGFAQAFGTGGAAELRTLAEHVLAPHGGWLMESYRAEAPAGWRKQGVSAPEEDRVRSAKGADFCGSRAR